MPPLSASSSAPASTTRRADTGGPTDPTPTPPPPPPDSARVREAEKLLKQAGFAPGRVDRHFSENTQKALEQFQRARGLDPSRGLDHTTMQALRQAARHARRGTLGAGQKGEHIKEVEQRLHRLGYDTGGRPDGIYDRDTAAAMKAFKNDDKIGNRPRTGLAGKHTREELRRDVAKLSHAPYRVRVKPSQQRRADDRRVDRALDRGPLREGNQSRATEVVQRTLRRAGYDPQRIDGTFDERTAGMVKEFQKKSGLEPTGVVNTRTWRKLKGTTMEARSPTDPKQRIGEIDSSAVKKTEQMLKKLGFNPGRVDGDYTKATERAVDRFRARHHMDNADGVGGGTLKKIRKAYKKKLRPNLNTVAGCAKFLLSSPNVSFWSGLSTGSDRANLQRLARGQPALVETPDAVSDRTIKPSLSMMKALVDMAKRGPFTITALTGGDHSSFSKHYRGLAVDVSPGAPAGNIGRFGGRVFNEGDHLHLYWGPGGP